MNSNFLLLNKCYHMFEYYYNVLINYPKSEILIKNSIEKTYYELIESLFAYNINDVEKIKQKYLKEFLVKLSMLDYYTKISKMKKILSKRQFEVLGNRFTEIRKMTYGLCKKDILI